MSLQKIIDDHKLDAEVLHFREEVATADQAAEALGIPKSRIVKSVLLILHETRPLLCILRGCDSIDFHRLREMLGVSNIRTALPQEVKQHTGLPVGAVHPLLASPESILDRRTLHYEYVYAGGGSRTSLLKISPHAILTFARLEDFSK